MSGHIFDMVNRIAQNKISKRKKFKGNNRDNIHSEKFDSVTEYDFPNVSRSDIEGIKQTIQQDTKIENRKSLYYIIASLLIAAFLVWLIITYYDLNKYSQFGSTIL